MPGFVWECDNVFNGETTLSGIQSTTYMNKETKVTFDNENQISLRQEMGNDNKIFLLMDQIKSRQIVIIITNDFFH